MLYLVKKYQSIPLVYKMVTAMVLGVIVGAMMGHGAAWFAPLGKFFLTLLKVIALPLVIVNLIAGISSLDDPQAFGRIGEELGPFTAAALPIGAYAPEWFMDEVHMSPEQAVRAFEDLKAGHFLAIHHSTFQLTDESPHEPMERLRREWLRCHYDRRRLWIPRAGDHIVL